MDKLIKYISPINRIGLFIQLLVIFLIMHFIPNLLLIIGFSFISTVVMLYINTAEFDKKSKKQESNRKILDGIININDSILKIDNIDELYQQILVKAVEIVDNAKMGSVLILGEDNTLEFKATVGFSFDKKIQVKIPLQSTFLYRSSKGQITKSCIINDVDQFNKKVIDRDILDKVEGTDFFVTQSTISAPIIINDQLFGMINVDNTKKNAFKDNDLLLMEYFASKVGTVIQKHQLLEEMKYLSQYDSLTKVYSRSYFKQLINSRFEEIQVEGGHFYIVLFDLNDLKQTNDTYGHQVGDELIIRFAAELKKRISQTDILARFGGDEFIAVLFNKDKSDVINKVRCVSKALEGEPILYKGKEIPIAFSYGISSYPDDEQVIKKLISVADTRMYQDKDRKKRIKTI